MAHEQGHQPDHETYSGHAAPHHQAPLTAYFLVFGALNTTVAMAIAVVKALVVILWFMHVIHSPRLTWIVVICSFLWLAVLFVLTFSDYLTRHWNIY